MFPALRLHLVRCCALGIAASGLLGCSVHPLPEDVTRSNTFDIVERIRCEAKAGLDRFAAGDKEAQAVIEKAVIGFDFTFEITEDNDLTGGELDFRRNGLRGFFTLDLGGSAERQRKNTRRFRIIEELAELKESACRPQETVGANLLYPIGGNIGMDEVVNTYIRLEKLTKGGLKKARVGELGSELDDADVAFGDVLKFTTELSASATPTLTLNPVGGGLRLRKASVTGTASRKDVHDVIVALAINRTDDADGDDTAEADGPEAAVTPVAKRFDAQDRARSRESRRLRWLRRKRALRRKAREERKEWLENELVGDVRTETALLEKDATARDRVLIKLRKLRNLQEDEGEAARRLGERLLELLREP